MADWADDEAGRIWRQRQAFADRAELESVLATALRKAKADGVREAGELVDKEGADWTELHRFADHIERGENG